MCPPVCAIKSTLDLINEGHDHHTHACNKLLRYCEIVTSKILSGDCLQQFSSEQLL